MAVRIGLLLSALAVLASILFSLWLVSGLGEWGENKNNFLGVVFVAAVYSGFALGFIWLGVFVAYVISKAVRVIREATRP